MAQVASIAANNDLTIGKVVADALEQVGSGGIVTIEDGKAVDNEVNWVEGMQFDKGYLSPYFVNHPESIECVLDRGRRCAGRSVDDASDQLFARNIHLLCREVAGLWRSS